MARRVPSRLALFLVAGTLVANPQILLAQDGDEDGGPVVLMGIDPEDNWRLSQDGEVGQHGPIRNYVRLVREILGRTRGSRTGLLVLGGGKNANDDVTTFWTRIAADVPEEDEPPVPLRFAHCNEIPVLECTDLETVVLTTFALVVVVSDANQTRSGGLTEDENDVLTDRHEDFAAFVNSGGGLLGFTSDFAMSEPYGYVAGLGAFDIQTDIEPGYSNIMPVGSDAEDLGITDALDVCCWHDVFTDFPDYLDVLAIDVDVTGRPAAVGGKRVRIEPTPPPPPPPPPPPTTGTGYMKLGLGQIDKTAVFHRFRLDCDPVAAPKRFKLNVVWFEEHWCDSKHRCDDDDDDDKRWHDRKRGGGKKHRCVEKHTFTLTQITSVMCTDNPSIRNPKKANFDTHTGMGAGQVDQRPGYAVSWEFVDGGQNKGGKARRDTAKITITTPSGDTVLSVSGPLSKGDQKARTPHFKK